MYTIDKTFRFEAAHQLNGLPPTHQCSRLHGHSYRVTIAITSNELEKEGWIKDFSDFAPFKTLLDTDFDHRFLNDVLKEHAGEEIPSTSENLAKFFFYWCKQNVPIPPNVSWASVTVSETETTSASYFQ